MSIQALARDQFAYFVVETGLIGNWDVVNIPKEANVPCEVSRRD